MTEPVLWRGLTFTLSPETHRDYERWDGEVLCKYGRPLWSADRYPPSEEWYARLLVGVYRITGQGPNMHLALDDALARAKELRRAISGALPK